MIFSSDEQWSENLPTTVAPEVSLPVVEQEPALLENVENKENEEGRPSINESVPIEKQADVRLGSGDSWEHEFDESDIPSENTNPSESTTTTTTEKLPTSSTNFASTIEKTSFLILFFNLLHHILLD